MTQQPDPMVDEGLRGRIPGEALNNLEAWCQNERVKIELEGFLSGGKTRAEVAIVMVYAEKGPSPRRDVLKHCPPPEGGLSLDAATYNDAKNADQKFAGAHLAALDMHAQDGRQGIFLLMEWRGGGARKYVPLTSFLGQEALAGACRTVVKSILIDWQKDWKPRRASGRVAAHDILQVIAGNKCLPGRSLHNIARDLDIVEADRLLIDETEVCNPFLTVSQNKGLAQFRTAGIRGNGHGDLHPGNILVPSTAKPGGLSRQFDEYYLIDLSSFDNNRFLAIDPAHLMLSLANECLGELSSRQQDLLCELILDPAGADAGSLPSGIAAAMRAISQVGRDHYDDGTRRLFEDWYQETLLAIAGCALLFVGRNADFRSRSWFLRLGGMAIDMVNGYVAGRSGEQATSGPQGGRPVVNKLVAPVSSAAQQTPAEEQNPANDEHPASDDQAAEDEPAEDSAPREPDDSKVVFISETARRFSDLRAGCSGLLAEFADAVGDLEPYLGRRRGMPGTSAIRDVLDDLARSAAALDIWREESSYSHRLSVKMVIAQIKTRLNQAADLAHEISENGSTPGLKARLVRAAGELDDAFQYFFALIIPDQPVNP
jgi:hypothetical protein